MIREAPTSSSSESNFTDPESHFDEDVAKTLRLTITKLEQLDIVSDLPPLNVVHYEAISLDGGAEAMPIVKSNSEENGCDKGIFSVSRVKKVELPERKLPTDICAARKKPLERRISHISRAEIVQLIPLHDLLPALMISLTTFFSNLCIAPCEQQAIVSGSSNNNNVIKSSNGSGISGGNVLQRVITLTTASHVEHKTPPKTPPAYVPEKLHFSAYEKFEGEKSFVCLRAPVRRAVIKERNFNDELRLKGN